MFASLKLLTRYNMYRNLKILFLIYLSCMSCVECGNILWLSGLISRSHQIWVGPLQRALASKGHNVTVLSADIFESTTNLEYLHMDNVYEYFSNKTDYNLDAMIQTNTFKSINVLSRYRAEACIPAFQSQGVKKLMSYPKNFRYDLIIHDFAGGHCLLGFSKKFGEPALVSLSATSCPVAISGASGNPQYPLFMPANHLHTGYAMSWCTRLHNMLLYVYDNIVRAWYMMPNQNKMAAEFFEDPDLDVAKMSKSSVLTLVNLPPYDVMQPLYKSIVPVAGLHIEDPKPLNDVLTKFIAGAEAGIVFFALGSNIKSENFSPEKINYFLQAFRHFPEYRFLWKFDPNLIMFDTPDNVLLMKWLPQNDILAHPKIKAFISHGGALSCHEAVWYGVPRLMIPFIIDQKLNTAKEVERGIAISLDHEDLSVEKIRLALNTVLNDNKIRQKVRHLSKMFRDQPEKPLDRAMFWIEHVIEHGKDSMLRSPAQDGGLIENFTLDTLYTVCVMILTQIVLLVISNKIVKKYF